MFAWIGVVRCVAVAVEVALAAFSGDRDGRLHNDRSTKN
jgi:hypothetical protein